MNSALLFLSAARPTSLGLPFIDGGAGAMVKMLLPVLGFLAIAPLLWLFFRKTWKELDDEATDYRQERRNSGTYDYRPMVLFAIVALILTCQEYYGGSRFYGAYIRPWLKLVEVEQLTEPGGWGKFVNMRLYGELYAYAWWAITRILGYTLVPMLAWKIIFRKDSLLDMGLRTSGMREHAWIYGVALAVVLPLVYLVAQSPEFANYYPFYKKCSRSWVDLIAWEALYIGQFFALEVFFRGFMLVPLRRNLGAGAIVAMCVPYVMIHYGKPYLEAQMAFVAGLTLGSLAMKTRSIYAGVLVHVTVALMMDGLALRYGGGFPTQWFP